MNERREQRKSEREQKRSDPVWQARKEERRRKWKRAGIAMANGVLFLLRWTGLLPGLPSLTEGNLKNESNIFLTENKNRGLMKNFNQTTFNPLSLVLETIVRLFSRSPKYFRVLQWIVFIIGGALALLNYAVDPSVAIDVFGPKAHDVITTAIKYLGIIYFALRLPVEEQPAPEETK